VPLRYTGGKYEPWFAFVSCVERAAEQLNQALC
jgi:hypothetical protein